MSASLIGPKTHYVYRAYDADGLLLYVGCTGKYRHRMEGHEKASAWWPFMAEITYKSYPDRATARAAESDAIYRENPAFNIASRSVSPRYARAGRSAYLAANVGPLTQSA